MKKRFFIFSPLFLLVLSGCGVSMGGESASNSQSTVNSDSQISSEEISSLDSQLTVTSDSQISSEEISSLDSQSTEISESESSSSSSEQIHQHQLFSYSLREATTSRAGCSAYYSCSGCSEIFSSLPTENVESVVNAGEATVDVDVLDWRYIAPIPVHQHDLTHYQTREATTTQAGCLAYYSCSGCSEIYSALPSENVHSVAEGGVATILVANSDWRYIAPLPIHQHTIISYTQRDATTSSSGCRAYYTCTGCHEIYSSLPSENVESVMPGGVATVEVESTDWRYIAPLPIHQHALTHYLTREATTSRAGCKEYYSCSGCSEIFNSLPTEHVSSVTEGGVANIDVTSTDWRYIAMIAFSAFKNGVAPTYNEDGMLGHYVGVGSNVGKLYDENYNEVTSEQLRVEKFKASCPDVLDDLFNDNKNTKSTWSAVNDNVNNWTHVNGSHQVFVPADKAGWRLTKQEYTDFEMKIKLDGVMGNNPYADGRYLTKAFFFGADASSANGMLPGGYALTICKTGGDDWLQLYYLEENNMADYKGTFVSGVFGDFANREITVKMRGNVLSLWDEDGEQIFFLEKQLGTFFVPELALSHYKGGKIGLFNWTDDKSCDSTFYINEFSGVKKEEAYKYEIKAETYNKQNPNKRVSVFVMAGQSNMEGNSRAYDNINTSNYLRNYCNNSSYNYDELMTGYNNVHISYHTNYPYGTVNARGKIDASTGHNYSNQDDYLAGKFENVKVGQGLFPNRYFGPELGMAEELHKLAPNEEVYIIKYAAGGTGYVDRGAWNSPSSGSIGVLYGGLIQFVYNNLRNIAASGNIPVIKGFCWMQGESDSTYTEEWATNRYQYHLSNMVSDFKEEFSDFAIDNNGANINFIDGLIYTGSGTCCTYGNQINAAKTNIANSNVKHFVLTGSSNYHLNGTGYGGGDGWHYDVDGMLNLGKDFADTIINNNMLAFTSTPSSKGACHDGVHANVQDGYCLSCQTFVTKPQHDFSYGGGGGAWEENFAVIGMSGYRDFRVQFDITYSDCTPTAFMDGPWVTVGGQDINSDFLTRLQINCDVYSIDGNFYQYPNGPKITDKSQISRSCNLGAYGDNADEWCKGKASGTARFIISYQAIDRIMIVDMMLVSNVPGYEGRVSNIRYKFYVGFGSGTAYDPVYVKTCAFWTNMRVDSLKYEGLPVNFYTSAVV